MDIYHEIDVTDLPAERVIAWCETCLEGDWNVVADSGKHACRGTGGHVVILLCSRLSDAVMFRMAWF